MAEQPIPSDIASLSFEDALRALEEIVRQLEGGQVRLDEAVGAYEKGSFLKRHCERITVSPDGAAAGSEPFDVG
jgi:exodeoxyribonuclease VII small subunit